MGTSIDMGSMNMEDSVSSVPDSSSSGEGFSERDEVAEIKKGASVQTRRVRTWRLIVTGVLLATGAVVSTLTYRLLLGGQVENYDDAFAQLSGTIFNSLTENQKEIREALKTLSNVLATYTETNTTLQWPFFDYASIDTFFKDQIEAKNIEGIGLISIVSGAERQSFLQYEAEYCEARNIRGHLSYYGNLDTHVPGVGEELFGQLDDGTFGVVPEADKHKVITYRYPPLDGCSLQWDTSTDPEYGPLTESLDVLRNETLMSSIRPYVETNEEQKKIHATYHSQRPGEEVDFPHTYVLTTVHDKVDTADSTIIGYLFANVGFDWALQNLFEPEVTGLYVVGENTCNQTFTYKVDGPDAFFLGYDVLHKEDFDDKALLFAFEDTDDPLYVDDRNHCLYTMSIYSSEEFRSHHVTKLPLIAACIITSAFLVMIATFYVYDSMVQKRNSKLIKEAAKSGEIVTSMFPGKLRNIVLKDGRRGSKVASATGSSHFEGEAKATESQAEYYDATTVFFADLAGFTRWASSREPAQVFHLLELIYGEFDAIAKRRRVFKIETVGDCYVAVTGFPKSQSDHALRMSRFAGECLKGFGRIIREKGDSFGSGTDLLKLRIGMHSGPVFAGVLRGDRARIQFYGDTMNTASRMESTGEPGRVQVSEDTAKLIMEAGKENWLIPREGLVPAKGKGDLQTYWLKAVGITYSAPSSHDETFNPSEYLDPNEEFEPDREIEL